MPEHTPAPTPARSLYGFFLYLFCKTMLGIYIIWAFVPEYYLHYFNIYYYPQKYWATAVPIQCLVALTLFAFIVYPSTNLMLIPDIDSLNTIKDSQSQYSTNIIKNYSEVSHTCVCSDVQKCYKNSFILSSKDVEENTVPQLCDLDIRVVCKKLYFNVPKGLKKES